MRSSRTVGLLSPPLPPPRLSQAVLLTGVSSSDNSLCVSWQVGGNCFLTVSAFPATNYQTLSTLCLSSLSLSFFLPYLRHSPPAVSLPMFNWVSDGTGCRGGRGEKKMDGKRLNPCGLGGVTEKVDIQKTQENNELGVGSETGKGGGKVEGVITATGV